jgi:hypothetical protein
MWGLRDDDGAELFNMAWKTDRSQLGVELAPGKSQEPKNSKKMKKSGTRTKARDWSFSAAIKTIQKPSSREINLRQSVGSG